MATPPTPTPIYILLASQSFHLLSIPPSLDHRSSHFLQSRRPKDTLTPFHARSADHPPFFIASSAARLSLWIVDKLFGPPCTAPPVETPSLTLVATIFTTADVARV